MAYIRAPHKPGGKIKKVYGAVKKDPMKKTLAPARLPISPASRMKFILLYVSVAVVNFAKPKKNATANQHCGSSDIEQIPVVIQTELTTKPKPQNFDLGPLLQRFKVTKNLPVSRQRRAAANTTNTENIKKQCKFPSPLFVAVPKLAKDINHQERVQNLEQKCKDLQQKIEAVLKQGETTLDKLQACHALYKSKMREIENENNMSTVKESVIEYLSVDDIAFRQSVNLYNSLRKGHERVFTAPKPNRASLQTPKSFGTNRKDSISTIVQKQCLLLTDTDSITKIEKTRKF